jgi:hypothetical protein
LSRERDRDDATVGASPDRLPRAPRMGEAPPVRVFLRPIGSPLTVGMAGLAIASLTQSGLDLRWISIDQTHQVGLILISVPFVLQLLACVLSYLARDGALGAAIGVLSVSWLAEGLVHLGSSPGSRSGALGLLLLAAGGVLALSAGVVAVVKPLPAMVLGIAGVRFLLAGVYQLGATDPWRDAGGVAGLVAVALAGYVMLAFELEGQQHRPVLPTFRRGSARLDRDPDQLVGALAREPGVRETT